MIHVGRSFQGRHVDDCGVGEYPNDKHLRTVCRRSCIDENAKPLIE
jgi:hypothetical protein